MLKTPVFKADMRKAFIHTMPQNVQPCFTTVQCFLFILTFWLYSEHTIQLNKPHEKNTSSMKSKGKRKKLLLCFQLSFLCLSPCVLTFLFQSLYYFLQLLIRFQQIIFWLRKWGKLELDIIYLLPKQKRFFPFQKVCKLPKIDFEILETQNGDAN